MKIYNEVVIDMDTGNTIYEDSFEYDGPVALCAPNGTDGDDDWSTNLEDYTSWDTIDIWDNDWADYEPPELTDDTGPTIEEYDPWGGQPFYPWYGITHTSEGVEYGQELEDIMGGVTEYWEGLTDPAQWAEIEGGWEQYADMFDPFENFYQEEVDLAIRGAKEEVTAAGTWYDLLAEQAFDEYKLGAGQAWEDWLDIQTSKTELWNLQKAGYHEKIYGLHEIWRTDLASWEQQRIGETAAWNLKEYAYERQISEADALAQIKADELYRQGIAAEDLWTLRKDNLDALGIDASEIWAIEKASLERQQQEETSLFGVHQAGFLRQASEAVDVWNIKAQDIARQKQETQTIWELQKEGLTEAWTGQKEALAYGARKGLKEAQKSQASAIMSMGFATGPTGIEGGETGIRREYGMQLTEGERELTSQLKIGTEALVQAQAALQTDLDLSSAELTSTLAGLDAAQEISQIEYDNEIARLSETLNIGEVDLINTLDNYTRDKAIGQEMVDEQLEVLKAQGLIDEVQTANLKNSIYDSITFGAQDLANFLGSLDANEARGLALFNKNIAEVTQTIAEGEMTLEHALNTGMLNYNQAIASGLLTYTDALDMGMTLYEAEVTDIYTGLGLDLYSIIGKWRAEQEAQLGDVMLQIDAAEDDDDT